LGAPVGRRGGSISGGVSYPLILAFKSVDSRARGETPIQDREYPLPPTPGSNTSKKKAKKEETPGPEF